MTTALSVTVRDLHIHAGDRTLVDGLSLDVAPGETLGIVGESGSGKSLTARALLGLLPPNIRADGSVHIGNCSVLTAPERELRALRGSTIALMLQDPFTMLNPLIRVGDQITETLRDQRGRRARRAARRLEATRRLAEVGIGDASVANRYPFELSGGMRQRVALAATLASDPQVLVADEPSTALDVTTQREILALLRSLQHARGMSVILITHDLGVAFSMCDRIYVLYAGRVLEVGESAAITRAPLHPYSLGLLLSEPPVDRKLVTLPTIEGSVPTADEVKGGCAFVNRCEWALPRCRAGRPPLTHMRARRETACLRAGEIGETLAERRAAVLPAAPRAPRGQQQHPYAIVERLTKSFATRNRNVVALDDVSMEVGEAESVGLVGESGSGKTTLARCLVGLETPDEGEIIVAGERLPRRLDPASRARLAARVQIVFQDPYSSLNPVRTVGATLSEALAARAGSGERAQRTVAELLDLVHLPASYAKRKPFALSGGERQRIAIARALALEPRLIVCDEPVSALDVSVQAQILNLFASLREELGMAYLFITHDLAVARQVVDRIYVLRGGKVMETGPTSDVLDAPRNPYTVRLLASLPRPEAEWLEGARA